MHFCLCFLCTIESSSHTKGLRVSYLAQWKLNRKDRSPSVSDKFLFLYGPPFVHPVTFPLRTRSSIYHIREELQPFFLKLLRQGSIVHHLDFQSFWRATRTRLTTATRMFFLNRLRKRRQTRTGLSRYRFTLFRQRLHPQSRAAAPATQHPYSILT